MSCIDSAIINTLVEHMNSGTGNKQLFKDLGLPGYTTEDGSDLIYHGELKFGYLLLLKHRTLNTVLTFICGKIDRDMNGALTYTFYGQVNHEIHEITLTTVSDSAYKFTLPDNEYEMPDHDVTGMYLPTLNYKVDYATENSVGNWLRLICNGLHSQLNSLMSMIDAKADKNT